MKTRLNRRSLLSALGASAGLLPFLPVLDSEAETKTFPKRLILFYFPIGTHLADYRCSGGENDFALSPILQPLKEHRDNLIVLDGIDFEVGAKNYYLLGHPGIVSLFSGIEPLPGDFTTCTGTYGWAGGPTVDQYVADAYASQTPIRSLSVGTMLQTNPWSLPYSRISYRGANQPITPLEDPAAMFDYLFGNLTLEPEKAEKIRAARKSVIDSVAGDITSLQSKLSGSDRSKVEAHLDSLRILEKRIQNQVGASCMLPTKPESRICKYNAKSVCNESIAPDIFDLITSALSCDVTRVVAYQGASEGNGPRMPHHTELPHVISHRSDSPGFGLQTEVTTWWMKQLAQLLDRLAAVPEGDGTLLDNTVVLATSVIGEAWFHGERNIPVVLAGKAGGYLKTGRYLRFGDFPVEHGGKVNRKPHGGRAMNDLLISLCHAMDLKDVNTFGNPDYCTGPINELMG